LYAKIKGDLNRYLLILFLGTTMTSSFTNDVFFVFKLIATILLVGGLFAIPIGLLTYAFVRRERRKLVKNFHHMRRRDDYYKER
jgi:hypothetical protein